MTTTLDLFTKPFTMPDGTTRPPLVERVLEIRAADNPGACGYHRDALEDRLVVAAHRWAAENRPVTVAWQQIMHFAEEASVEHLIHACHLIADAVGGDA